MKGSTRRNSHWSRCALALTLAGVTAQFAGCADAPKPVGPAGNGGGNAAGGIAGASHVAGGAPGGASNLAGASAEAGSDDSGGEAGQTQSVGGQGGTPGNHTPEAGAAGEHAGEGEAGMGGAGGAPCDTGLVTCPGGPVCGTDLGTGHAAQDTVDDCGACGVSCSLTEATSATCVGGACQPTCLTGFADCETTTNDGCETDTTASVDHCGTCGHACSTFGAASRACTQQLCAPVCSPKYADCNVDSGAAADDGCEHYLDSLTSCGTTCDNGVACSAAQVCNAGACGAAQGLVAMSVPLTASAQNQRYADTFSPQPDLSNTTLMLRVYAPNATGGQLDVYMTDATSDFGPTVSVELSALAPGWMDIAVPIGAAQGNFDPAQMKQVTIEVMSGSSTAWATPATVVYLDSIWTTNLIVNDTFDTTIGGMIPSTFQTVSGSTLTWADSLP